MKRYSNFVNLQLQIRRTLDALAEQANGPVRSPTPLPPEQRVDRRLSAETITELVQAYRDGMSTTQLRQRYELSQGSVIRILHGHGVQMRNQGLTAANITTAAELYQDGQTLARLGEQFGVSPNAVRRALVASGVVMRARGGSKARG